MREIVGSDKGKAPEIEMSDLSTFHEQSLSTRELYRIKEDSPVDEGFHQHPKEDVSLSPRSLFDGGQRLFPANPDILPSHQEKDSFKASLRAIIHASELGEKMPDRIQMTLDPDVKSLRLRPSIQLTKVQEYGAATLNKYLKPIQMDKEKETSRQWGKRIKEWPRNVLEKMVQQDVPYKSTDVKGSDQLRGALNNGPVMYDIRSSETVSSHHHIVVYDYQKPKKGSGEITYADGGTLFSVSDRTFFGRKYRQNNDFLLESTKEIRGWKDFQKKLRVNLITESDSSQQKTQDVFSPQFVEGSSRNPINNQ